ncbi:MAG: hypothetical protein P4M15_08675 [Alphaproteobacteria bacterium]|nr:hypothetical protein [Alphaproteobacteria bacterium]
MIGGKGAAENLAFLFADAVLKAFGLTRDEALIRVNQAQGALHQFAGMATQTAELVNVQNATLQAMQAQLHRIEAAIAGGVNLQDDALLGLAGAMGGHMANDGADDPFRVNAPMLIAGGNHEQETMSNE